MSEHPTPARVAGEPSLYCLDCQDFTPCNCDGLPVNSDVRRFPGDRR